MFAIGDIKKSGPHGRLVGNIIGINDLFGSETMFVRVWRAGENKIPSERHSHRDTDELIIVIKGWLDLEIDGEKLRLQTDKFLLKRPGSASQIIGESEDALALIVKAPWLPYDFVPQ